MEFESEHESSPIPAEHESSTSPERQMVRRGGRGRGVGRASPARQIVRRGRGGRAGRARGVGRTRGSRRGRGRGAAVEPNRRDVTAANREARDSQLKERISQLPEETARSLLFKACERDPSFALEIVNQSSADRRQGGYHPNPEDDSPSWCVCTKCRQMPSDQERVCCQQVPANCFSTLPDFDLIALDDLILAVAQRYREDIFAAAPDADFNRGRRHGAYRQFILWHHGFLGAGNRKVIPSCCVWRIRDRYPDEYGQYRGFVGGRLG